MTSVHHIFSSFQQKRGNFVVIKLAKFMIIISTSICSCSLLCTSICICNASFICTVLRVKKRRWWGPIHWSHPRKSFIKSFRKVCLLVLLASVDAADEGSATFWCSFRCWTTACSWEKVIKIAYSIHRVRNEELHCFIRHTTIASLPGPARGLSLKVFAEPVLLLNRGRKFQSCCSVNREFKSLISYLKMAFEVV